MPLNAAALGHHERLYHFTRQLTLASAVQAACKAGMPVVAIPSTVDKQAYEGCDCEFLPSLLQFDPQLFGLPPFDDKIAETVPLDVVWRVKGPVVKGFGRGSRVRAARRRVKQACMQRMTLCTAAGAAHAPSAWPSPPVHAGAGHPHGKPE